MFGRPSSTHPRQKVTGDAQPPRLVANGQRIVLTWRCSCRLAVVNVRTRKARWLGGDGRPVRRLVARLAATARHRPVHRLSQLRAALARRSQRNKAATDTQLFLTLDARPGQRPGMSLEGFAGHGGWCPNQDPLRR